MTRPPAISVVLPYRDRADVLGESIESVLNQTFGDLELLLVNDGSVDDSESIARQFSDSRCVHLAAPRPEGVCHARNRAIDAARGRFLAFQDSDDIWAPTKLHRQLHWLHDVTARFGEPIAAIGCGWRLASGEPSPPFSAGPFGKSDVLRGVRGLRTPCLLLDRAIAVVSARFDLALPALVDRDYVIAALPPDGRVTVAPEELLTVRRGRTDHVAAPTRSAVAYERYLIKYEEEFSRLPDARRWYAFQAMRDWLRVGRPVRALRHIRSARDLLGWRAVAHFGAGATARGLGLNVMARLLPVEAPTAQALSSSA